MKMIGLVAALTLTLAGCGATGTPATGTATTSSIGATPTAVASKTLRPTPRPTIALVPVATTSLNGTGSKTGPVIVLAGDYVLHDSVKTKPGCHFALYLDGLDDAPMDEVTTDSAGSNTTEADMIGLELRTYTIRVVATKCGAWSVRITRK